MSKRTVRVSRELRVERQDHKPPTGRTTFLIQRGDPGSLHWQEMTLPSLDEATGLAHALRDLIYSEKDDG